MIQIDRIQCTGCGTCVNICPSGALFVAGGHADVDEALCNSCGQCIEVCPEGALSLAVATPQTREVQPLGQAQPPARSAPRGIVSALSRGVLPAIGTAIAFAGREILPRIVDTWLSERAAVRSGDKATTGDGRRLRRRRRGKS